MTHSLDLLLSSGILLFFMLIGMTLFTAGMVQAKNIISTFVKNIAALSIMCLTYFFLGYELVYAWPTDAHFWQALFAQFTTHYTEPHQIAAVFWQALQCSFILFIINSATAERLKLWAFLFLSLVIAAVSLPLLMHWTWGGGFLSRAGFFDATGTGVIYLSGAIAGLVSTLLLGPRRGKCRQQLNERPLQGANMPLSTVGGLLFLIGTFGFNISLHTAGKPVEINPQIALIFLNTLCAGLSGLLTTIVICRLFYGAVDLTFALNGLFAGLVVISMTPMIDNLFITFCIAAITSLLVLITTVYFEKWRIDDPGGAIAVFGTASTCGFMAYGLSTHFMHQVYGFISIILWVGVSTLIVALLLQFIMGIRVSKEQESLGLDIVDCGMSAYPEFMALRE